MRRPYSMLDSLSLYGPMSKDYGSSQCHTTLSPQFLPNHLLLWYLLVDISSSQEALYWSLPETWTCHTCSGVPCSTLCCTSFFHMQHHELRYKRYQALSLHCHPRVYHRRLLWLYHRHPKYLYPMSLLYHPVHQMVLHLQHWLKDSSILPVLGNHRPSSLKRPVTDHPLTIPYKDCVPNGLACTYADCVCINWVPANR